MLPKIIAIGVLLLLAVAGASQTTSPPQDARTVIRLKVRVAEGTKAAGLQRKRFFLIKGSREQNKALIASIEEQPVLSRDCYYRSQGASEPLISWLKENDCESVYCREVEPKNIEGAAAVLEFQRAVAAGEKEFGNRELARKWITMNLANELRNGFYKRQQQSLQAFLTQAESLSQVKVGSVMTDRNGTAYFTDVEPGEYIISNILPAEFGNKNLFWNCSITIKRDDLGTTQFLIVNQGNKDRRDARNNCVSVEEPIPVCESTQK